MTKFLAEDFRKLVTLLEDITNANDEAKDNKEKTKAQDIGDLLKSDRPEDISKEDIHDIKSLIDYLDQFAELNNWRDPDARYDDAYYRKLPLDKLFNIADLSKEDLDRIDDETPPYEGGVWYDDNGLVWIHGAS